MKNIKKIMITVVHGLAILYTAVVSAKLFAIMIVILLGLGSWLFWTKVDKDGN